MWLVSPAVGSDMRYRCNFISLRNAATSRARSRRLIANARTRTFTPLTRSHARTLVRSFCRANNANLHWSRRVGPTAPICGCCPAKHIHTHIVEWRLAPSWLMLGHLSPDARAFHLLLFVHYLQLIFVCLFCILFVFREIHTFTLCYRKLIFLYCQRLFLFSSRKHGSHHFIYKYML